MSKTKPPISMLFARVLVRPKQAVTFPAASGSLFVGALQNFPEEALARDADNDIDWHQISIGVSQYVLVMRVRDDQTKLPGGGHSGALRGQMLPFIKGCSPVLALSVAEHPKCTRQRTG
jgi:hypothetical protein